MIFPMPYRLNILLLFLLVPVGCGSSEQAKTKAILGTVTYAGKPLSQGSVLFVPEKGRAANAQIQTDGSYTLGTFNSTDGAVMGKHRVAVICRKEAPPLKDRGGIEISRAGPSLIPGYYSDIATSGLTFEVTAEGPSTFDIQLE